MRIIITIAAKCKSFSSFGNRGLPCVQETNWEACCIIFRPWFEGTGTTLSPSSRHAIVRGANGRELSSVGWGAAEGAIQDSLDPQSLRQKDRLQQRSSGERSPRHGWRQTHRRGQRPGSSSTLNWPGPKHSQVAGQRGRAEKRTAFLAFFGSPLFRFQNRLSQPRPRN